MKTFKKYLFWVISPLTFIIHIIAGALSGIGNFIEEADHSFEAWCFDYKDTGLIYRGDGIWSSPIKGATE